MNKKSYNAIAGMLGTHGFVILGLLVARKFTNLLKENMLNPLLVYNTKDI